MRVIRWFNSDSDEEELVGEHPVGDIDVRVLQELYRIPPNNPMYDSYYVCTMEQIHFVEALLGTTIDRELYDYFIEFDAE